nr:hypothetical protein [Tanacetum cinerariifolium]
MIPRSCLWWKRTSRIFKTVGLRWVPTGKIFTSSTTKVDSEPTNGLNEDVTNQYECEHTLDVSACTLNLSSEHEIYDHNNEPSSSKLVLKVIPPADKTTTSQQKLELLFSPMYEEYFNARNPSSSNINKSSSSTDNSKQRDTPPTTNIQSTPEPSTQTNVHAEENNDNQAEDEFTNPLCTPIQEVAESSSRNI